MGNCMYKSPFPMDNVKVLPNEIAPYGPSKRRIIIFKRFVIDDDKSIYALESASLEKLSNY